MSDHSTVRDRAGEVVDEFSLFDDWMGRYEHLIDQARYLEPLDDEFRRDEFRIRGCQSQVWLTAEFVDGLVEFRADSDAMITRGLIALLVRVYGGLPPSEIADADLWWLDEIGMREHLSSTRKNGLDAMHRRMKEYAAGFSKGQEVKES
jgi:cysteine desulfuration protein SufE